ncbi:adenylyltransferase/cytidyltransferase family protein [Halodesulfurarchaeum sp.]|uniref:adenylyltransferase/cytidyltransferase family protein n=1 Tax=Halodesulfurarchaeum sp. TaxID=1980530 RepID=UPI001BC2BC3E|nr:FAD synthase [Halodesulfurarchaeum sp.]
MTRVVAQGTFDLLHPGHIHYLTEATAMGDELHVIIARRSNVTHKEPPILPNQQRRNVIAALEMVDAAHVGDESDIFAPIEMLDPDVIALGYDQHHDVASIEQALEDRGINCRVERVSGREPQFKGEILSTGDIIDRIIDHRTSDED